MVTTLTLPALAFLMAISGIPGLSSLPGLRALLHHKPHAAVADTVRTQWTPSSALALQPFYLRDGLAPLSRAPVGITLNPSLDPRQLKTSVDPDSGFRRTSVAVGEFTLGAPYRRPLANFGSASMRELFAAKWQDTSRQKVNSGIGSGVVSQRNGLSVPIPVQLPTVVTSILGPGGPALNVSGSENIRLSGTSDWSNQQTVLLGSRKSLFPSLDMQQDLNIQLEGQLSDRVKINLLQNSANQVPLANRIAINYHGEEDDLIQELDLGNTSLALPGTQYVSYSGRNDGLLGIKVATRIGALDFTALASKQEGKSERASYTGGASSQPHNISDVEYDKGRYFLLYDPEYQLFDIDDRSIQIYRDDANYGNNTNTVQGAAMVDPDGRTRVPAASDSTFRGSFDLLNPIDDYEILPDYYVLASGIKIKLIRLKIPVTNEMCLGASFVGTPVDRVSGAPTGAAVQVGGYTKLFPDPALSKNDTLFVLKMLRAPRSKMGADSLGINFDPNGPFEPVRELEMKNFYSLQGFQIDPTGFKLSIQKGVDQPPVVYTHLPDGTGVNYLEVLGLDNYDESQATRKPGHDEKVDGSAYTSGARLFIDYQNGVLWFPDPRPFAPRVRGTNARWFDSLINANLVRRLALTGTRDSVNEANDFYDLYNPIESQAMRYQIVAQFAAARGGGDITLGRGNILPGSDVVTVNGERWTRDRDYSIDYDLGHVTLRRNLGATDQLSVDYSYAPLFAQASKTLLGSAFRLEGRDRSLGGAFLYESQGAQDLRPRLGEEPSRTVITDLNTEWRFKPDFVTRAINHLPGVHTTAPSDLTVQAEVGASFPNPNTKNEVYIDDMEGVRDAVSLALTPERWTPMSVPSRPTTVVDGVVKTKSMLLDTLDASNARMWNAELHWYMPPNVVKEKDLKPSLRQGQGPDNPHQVLALSVPRMPTTVHPDKVWAGLTYQLDNEGIDLSRSQFIELWVNDFNDRHDPAVDDGLVRRNHLMLHIDLGVVSENQMRAPNRKPDSLLTLQSEDVPPRDHQLTVTSGHDEDTGYDGIDDTEEKDRLSHGTLTIADLVTANDGDPEGDDWGEPGGSYHDIDPRHWVHTNGTEGNKKIYPYPNTEDLNLNDHLDTDENYYEYTVDMGQTLASGPYEVTDVNDELGGNTDNGWRRFRIPILDKLALKFGSPDLTIARHIRLWIDGLTAADPPPAANGEQRPLLMIGGFDIVGSRWISATMDTTRKRLYGTTATLNSVSSVDNAEIYVPPFDPGQSLNGNQLATRQERTISLEFTGLGPQTELEAYRTFSIDEDYSRYKTLTWYAAAYDVPTYDPAVDSLYYFVRFASDERGENYYEVRRKLPASSAPHDIHWEQLKVPITDLSRYKLEPTFPHAPPYEFHATLGDGSLVTIMGRPSFTRLRRISFGVVNAYADSVTTPLRTFQSGQFWFDEIRATDVAKDVGFANRLLVSGHMANLASYNVSWNSRDADFLSVGESRGTGSRTTSLAVTTQFEPQRFFEGTGIQLPVSFVYNANGSKPRFSAGDDVVRTGAQQDASQTRAVTKSYSTSYSRVWSDRSNALLRYSIGGLSANAGRSQSDNVSPTGVSHGDATNAAVSWSVAPRNLLPLGLPRSKLRFYPLPERMFWSWNVSESKNLTQTRSLDDPTQLRTSSQTSGRSAGLSFGADSRPLDFLSHHIDAARSLSLSGPGANGYRMGGLNFGRTTAWHQGMNARWGLQRGPWLQPSFTWTSNFSSTADLQSENLAVHSVSNGQQVQVNWTFPFDQLVHSGSATMFQPPPQAQAPAPPDSAHPVPDSVRVRPRAPRHLTLRWRDVLMRVGNLQTDASLGRSSNFSRLTGQPTLLYTLGLTDDPGLSGKIIRTALDRSGSTQRGTDWRVNARTRVPLVYASAVSMRFSVGDRASWTNDVATRTADARFPDMDFEYGRLAEAIRLTRFLQSPSLRTSWLHSLSSDYRGNSSNKVGTSTSDDFHPLLSLHGNTKSGLQADLSVNKRSSVREVIQFGTSTTKDDNTDLNLTLSRNYSAGQKIKILGKAKTVRTSGSLQLATVYSHHTGSTLVSNSRASTRPIDDTRLSVTGTGNYGFSSSVTGSAVLGFSQSHDNTLDIIHRSIRVELRAAFTF